MSEGELKKRIKAKEFEQLIGSGGYQSFWKLLQFPDVSKILDEAAKEFPDYAEFLKTRPPQLTLQDVLETDSKWSDIVYKWKRKWFGE